MAWHINWQFYDKQHLCIQLNQQNTMKMEKNLFLTNLCTCFSARSCMPVDLCTRVLFTGKSSRSLSWPSGPRPALECLSAEKRRQGSHPRRKKAHRGAVQHPGISTAGADKPRQRRRAMSAMS
jgi:hypothetical protein